MASRVLADRAVRPSVAAAAGSTSTEPVPPFTKAQCTDGAHAVQDQPDACTGTGKSPGAGEGVRYRFCNAAPGRFVRTRAPASSRRRASTRCAGGRRPRSPNEDVLAANEADAEAVKLAAAAPARRRSTTTSRVALLRPHRRGGGRTLVHRPAPRRGRRRHAGGRRLAGRRRHAVLPGDARRSVRPRPPAPLRVQRPRADRRLRGGLRRSRLARRLGRRARPAARRARPGAHRPDARHRRDDPGRAGRDHPRAARDVPRRAGRSGHRQDRGRSAPRRVPALRAPRRASRAKACSSSARTRCSCATSARCCRRSARRRRRRRRSTVCSRCGSASSPRTPIAVAAVKGDARMADVDRARRGRRDPHPGRRRDRALPHPAADDRARDDARGAGRRRARARDAPFAAQRERFRAVAGPARVRPRTRAASRSSSTSRSSAPSCSPTRSRARRSTAAGAV